MHGWCVSSTCRCAFAHVHRNCSMHTDTRSAGSCPASSGHQHHTSISIPRLALRGRLDHGAASGMTTQCSSHASDHPLGFRLDRSMCTSTSRDRCCVRESSPWCRVWRQRERPWWSPPTRWTYWPLGRSAKHTSPHCAHAWCAVMLCSVTRRCSLAIVRLSSWLVTCLPAHRRLLAAPAAAVLHVGQHTRPEQPAHLHSHTVYHPLCSRYPCIPWPGPSCMHSFTQVQQVSPRWVFACAGGADARCRQPSAGGAFGP